MPPPPPATQPPSTMPHPLLHYHHYHRRHHHLHHRRHHHLHHRRRHYHHHYHHHHHHRSYCYNYHHRSTTIVLVTAALHHHHHHRPTLHHYHPLYLPPPSSTITLSPATILTTTINGDSTIGVTQHRILSLSFNHYPLPPEQLYRHRFSCVGGITSRLSPRLPVHQVDTDDGTTIHPPSLPFFYALQLRTLLSLGYTPSSTSFLSRLPNLSIFLSPPNQFLSLFRTLLVLSIAFLLPGTSKGSCVPGWLVRLRASLGQHVRHTRTSGLVRAIPATFVASCTQAR